MTSKLKNSSHVPRLLTTFTLKKEAKHLSKTVQTRLTRLYLAESEILHLFAHIILPHAYLVYSHFM
jgi:hypothetical protein